MYNFPLTNAEALSVNPVDNDNYTSYNWAELIVEFLYTIPNTPEHFFGFWYVRFTKTSAGVISGNFNNFMTRSYCSLIIYRFYRRPADHFRLMLEISWVFLQSWYIYSLLKSLRKYYINEARNHKLRNIQHKVRFWFMMEKPGGIGLNSQQFTQFLLSRRSQNSLFQTIYSFSTLRLLFLIQFKRRCSSYG